MIVYTRKINITDTAGAKVRARTQAGRQLTIPYPHEARDPHVAAIRALLGEHVEPEYQRPTPTGHRYYVPDSDTTGDRR